MKQLSPSTRGHKEEAEEGKNESGEGRKRGGRDYTQGPASQRSKGSVSVIVANREPLCNGCCTITENAILIDRIGLEENESLREIKNEVIIRNIG